MYKAAARKIPAPGRARLVYTTADGTTPQLALLHEINNPGAAPGVNHLAGSMRTFSSSCVTYALSARLDLWFGAKDTISKIYHGDFKKLFGEEVQKRHADFEQAGIHYTYMLIDDAVARSVRHPGGFLWACMNYDGDVMSDM